MKFDLLLTNQRRVQWLRGTLLTYAAGCLGLLGLHATLSFWVLVAPLVLVLVLLPLRDRLFRQAAWVLVAADGVAWANPATSPPVRCQFADLRAYRFEWSKISIQLRLHLRDGAKISLSSRLHEEGWAMAKAFRQAVEQYNQANPGATVEQEKDALAKFFGRSSATNVLFVLLAVAAGVVAWGVAHEAGPVLYSCLGVLLLPYLAVWASYYYERTPPVPVAPLAATATFEVWLTNRQRDRQGWVLLPIVLVMLPGIGVLAMKLFGPVKPAWFAGTGAGLVCLFYAWERFVKWASDPARITFNADQLVVVSPVADQCATILFAEVKDYQANTYRGQAWLLVELRDKPPIRLQAGYALGAFQKMSAEFERRFNVYQYQHRPPQPTPRR